MTLRHALLLVFFVATMQAVAAEPTLGPVIAGYGPTYPIDDRDVELEEGAEYMAVFDIAAYTDDVASVNYRLVSVARFLNMHARNGVPVENMDLAVVVHGGAVKNLLTHKSYDTRFGSDNPNLDLLRKLHEAGVAIYLCGQSMSFGGIQKDELAQPVQVALSAMTMLTVLQNDGYAVLQ